MTALVGKQPSRPPASALGINIEKPSFPQYAVYSKRLDSFATWPEYLPVRKEELVEAGLVFTGVGDHCRCYHCGGGLKNWEYGDIPMKEHARWYPKCPHVLLVKGQAYVDRVRNKGPVEEEFSLVDTCLTNNDKLIQSAAALSCILMGFSPAMVQKAIDLFIRKNRRSDFKGVDLCEILFEMEDTADMSDNQTVTDESTDNITELTSEELKLLREENEQLKESHLCKVCLDKEADIIFLPCGHMICCPQCAPAVSKCPVCRKCINGQVKAYFATSGS